jgi:tight adherence protein B
MTAAIAIRSVGSAEALGLVVAVVGLYGIWLLAANSARRSLLVERGGVELRRRRGLVEALDARLMRTQRGADLAGKLRSAGTQLTPSRYLGALAAGMLAAFLITSLLFPPLLAVIAAIVVPWGGSAWVARRLTRRNEEFINQLPEVARLLSNGASAGLSMPAAIELAVREIDAPAREELQGVLDEVHFGRSLDEALETLARRLPSRELAVLMTTLIIQQRAGGDLVRALQDLSNTLDMRRETLREVRTLMAGAVFTSYIVPLLGLGALVMLNSINSQTLPRMTSSPIGIAALVIAGVLYALGTLMIRRITRIEV